MRVRRRLGRAPPRDKVNAMPTLKELGEREVVSSITKLCPNRSGNVRVRNGDDAAVITGNGDTVVCTDIVGRERHMPQGMTYERFGWTSAAVCFSDLAAMGARPGGFLPSISAPEDMEIADLMDIVSGIDQCCEFAETSVIGGDTKPGELSVAGTAVGYMEGRQPMTRSGAGPGDIVAVTGCLGEPAVGFWSLGTDIDAEDEQFSLYVPVPRVKEGISLAESDAVTSCIDLSDGLSTAASEICARSHVGMSVVWEFLPLGDRVEDLCSELGKDVKQAALGWGGEYGLLFTFRKDRINRLYDAGIQFSIIGTVDNRDGPYLRMDDREEAMGYGVY